MNYLIGVTLLWSFSFSLIGVYLAGQVDAYFSVLTRIALASLVFLPFLRRRWLRPDLAAKLMALGAIQLGIMYLFYYHSFLLLTVPEVLVFTIFTPIYVTLLHDLLEGRFKPTYLWGALLAVLGAAVIRFDGLTESYVLGFMVVQGPTSVSRSVRWATRYCWHGRRSNRRNWRCSAASIWERW